ncbi:MAG: hypothetical protein K5860_00160 [Bacteroidales bacterium]|nr:hypothetical protein [Bacteroidales bacterium]
MKLFKYYILTITLFLTTIVVFSQNTIVQNITPLGFSGDFTELQYGKSVGLIALNNYGVLYTSKDTGRTWIPLLPPLEKAQEIVMYNETLGFIYNETQMYRTTDGCATWQELSMNGVPKVLENQNVIFNSLKIKNEDTLFLAVRNKINGLKLYMSGDKGNTWKMVAKDIMNNWIGGVFLALHFDSPLIGYGYCYGCQIYTEDGGETWTNTKYSNFEDSYLMALKSVKGGVLLHHLNYDTNNSELFWCESGAMKEKKILYKNIGGNFISELVYLQQFSDTIIMVDNDYFVYKSYDYGENWIVDSINYLNWRINKAYFFNGRVGVLVGMNLTSYVTLDGGETWTKYVHGGGERFSGGIRDIYVKNENECFITGNTGRLFHISDDGDSWSWNDVHNQTIHELTFLTRDIGYLVGKNILLKTLDGGNTWLGQSIKISNAMYLDFPSIDTGFVGYSDLIPSIHKTENGGKNLYSLYTKEYRINKTNRAPFAFLTTQKGLVCADNNKILYTPDGCETWEVKSISDNENMEERDIVAVGTQGWLISVIEDRKTKIYYVDTTFSISIIHEFEESEGKGLILRKVSDTLFCIGMFQNEKRNLYFGNLTEWRKTDIPFYTTFYAYNEHVIYTYDANTTSVYKVIVYDDSLQVSLQKESSYKYTLFSNVQNVPLNLSLTNISGEFVWSGQLNSGNGESTIDFPETIENGSYLMQIEPEKGYYYKTTEPVEVILDANDTPIKELSQTKNYLLCGNTLYVESSSVKIFTVTGKEIPLFNKRITLKSGIYLLVDGNETYKIVIE